MPGFYEQLDEIEKRLEHLVIDDLDGGLITVNGHLIDSNQQFEMLSPDFFSGTADQNPVIKAYQLFFQQMGILPTKTPEIPLIRDIPLRMKTHSNQLAQQQICARFLEENILTNNLSMLFADEYRDFHQKISLCLKNQQTAIGKKLITTDEEGVPLCSGGYYVELHQINGIKLWLRTPASTEDNDIATATDNSLQDSANGELIVGTLKFKLLEKNRIAFNVRGVAKTIGAKNDLRNLGGGHQHFLLLDKNTQTIYAINNTIGATDEDPRSFKVQIELFLQSLGDHHQYQFEFIQGKSRQPDNASYLRQVCNISQFCHYAALLSDVRIDALHDVIPPKITTLMYLLQYAVVNQDEALSVILNDVISTINRLMEQEPQPLSAVDHRMLDSSVATHQTQLLNDKVSQHASATDVSGKEKLINIIDILIDNIKNQHNGRSTNRNSNWKTQQLTALQKGLRDEHQSTPEVIQLYIDEIRTVCAEKRNAFHFWATPHSVAEFEKLLTDNNIVEVANVSKISA
ncbi:hypothetical protein [uncultured Legionella sp.]|uniref:hypothetical protein n=1 Tax=uncultured Legionella sp. TaxID=210934 RepID=UPI002601F0B5|nr:hypothetical protein [uncultured Legionella sp.]